jgi:CDGSH-type Zn-finger protein
MTEPTPQVTITATRNGSYEVSGPVVMRDAAGNAYPLEPGETFWLCRCGQSGTKPFCDGSHKRVGFSAVELATVEGDVPAPES